MRPASPRTPDRRGLSARAVGGVGQDRWHDRDRGRRPPVPPARTIVRRRHRRGRRRPGGALALGGLLPGGRDRRRAASRWLRRGGCASASACSRCRCAAAPLLAMELAALERAAPGPARARGRPRRPGLDGPGRRPCPSPLTLLREYTSALRALLAGEEVSTPGNRYVRLDQVRLARPPDAPPPVHIGTEGPKSLALSGELADGTILTGGTTPAAVRAAREHIERGRWAAGRPRAHRVTVYLRAATGPGRRRGWRPDAGAGGWSRPRTPASPATRGLWRRPSAAGPTRGRTPSCCSPPPTTPIRRASSPSPAARSRRSWPGRAEPGAALPPDGSGGCRSGR